MVPGLAQSLWPSYNSGDEDGIHDVWALNVTTHHDGMSAGMAMATSLGTPSFDENQDKWEIYLTQLEAFFEANDINKAEKKRAFLISKLSAKVVGIIAGHCAPRKVNELSYQEALAFLNAHYAPKSNEVAANYKFFSRLSLQQN